MVAYAILKTIHVLAVVMFVGNITVGVFWKAFADRSGDPRTMLFAIRGIRQADKIFTIPGVILLVLAGFAAAGIGGVPILKTGWVLWALILFIVSGIAFGPLARAQRQLEDIARAGAESGTLDTQRYAAVSNTWNILGTIALVAPLIAVVLMVAKPALPAF